jgi:UDP-N-acetylglucosamine--N-acetylmuramyl-(pentapeptide) pyrophosphoryl-undecaprenol N-acetylglucosamine transferase
VAELAAAGVPGILVPFPHAVDDHQTKNARFLSDAGAAVLLPQGELAPERLAALLGGFDRARLADMAERARSLGRPDATRSVASACMELAP